MTHWLVSDTHFNHTKLDAWNGRSGDWQEKLYKGLADIPDGDTLIHLGDICIGNDTEIHDFLFSKEIGVLDGVKTILVRGNHDKASMNKYYGWGWDFVCDGLDLTIFGHYLHLTHRPQRYRSNISYNIHGHTHGNLHRAEEYIEFYDKSYHIDISPELIGYTPIKLETLLGKKAADRKYPNY